MPSAPTCGMLYPGMRANISAVRLWYWRKYSITRSLNPLAMPLTSPAPFHAQMSSVFSCLSRNHFGSPPVMM